MMKKALLIFTVLLLGIAGTANADLIYRGPDSLGNKLIYDDVQDITWYDFTNAKNSWANQVAWAEGLSINLGGEILDEWRLPSMVDGSYEYGYDGSTTAGYNITTSEMGHLFYVGLGNPGRRDTSGSTPTPPQ